MNESTSPRPVAPWVAPVVEELGKLSDLTLDGISAVCVPEEDPDGCFP
jgi:hypothetical protein